MQNGAVLIGDDGRIISVGPREGVPHPPGTRLLELPDAILLPGLVNAHTHLELTGFRETAQSGEFADWIIGIRKLKEARSPGDYLEAARAGLRECWAGGVTTIADTGDSGATFRALAELGGSGVFYQEVFGPHPDQLEESFGGLVSRMNELGPLASDRIRLGVSPHAPYTVSGPLFARVAEWARARGFPIAVHVAESQAESEFVGAGKGPFAEGWNRRGIPLLNDRSHWPPGRPAVLPASPVSWLASLGVLGSSTLGIHAINLSSDDIGLLRQSGSAVAHCPVSNARHRHSGAPLRELMAAGIPVGLGTDSVASVGRLDMFAEMRAARELGGLSDQSTVALATIGGARAVGLDRDIGTLTPGKWGDLIALRVMPGDPLAAVVAAVPEQCVLTLLSGRIVHSTLQAGPLHR